MSNTHNEEKDAPTSEPAAPSHEEDNTKTEIDAVATVTAESTSGDRHQANATETPKDAPTSLPTGSGELAKQDAQLVNTEESIPEETKQGSQTEVGEELPTGDRRVNETPVEVAPNENKEPLQEALATNETKNAETDIPQNQASNDSALEDKEKRNVVLGDGSEGRIMTLLLEDLIRLQRVIWTFSGKPVPESQADADLESVGDRILQLLQNGKAYELAGLKDVPRPFLRTKGQILKKTDSGFEDMSDEEAKNNLMKILYDAFTKDDIAAIATESPYREFKDIMDRKLLEGSLSPSASTITPLSKDALLLPCSDAVDDKLFEHQTGNKLIFNVASQLVTSFANNTIKRVEAALMIIKGLQDHAEIRSPEDKQAGNRGARFLLRSSSSGANSAVGTDESFSWTVLNAPEAAEFAVTFVFEVFLEKELCLIPGTHGDADSENAPSLASPSKNPVPEATDNDVLFGRGGMTNSHPGNRRFRDIIALHRPDYIRAVKMDKPAVARKIVRSIRMGHPRGRFLKKGEDGHWYDVGDRTAAEKTSQGLRERSNAEKRQRSALREALRIRKQDLEEPDEPAGDASAKSGGSGVVEPPSAKKAKTSDLAGAAAISGAGSPTAAPSAMPTTLNYVGTNLPVPLSLNMAQIVAANSSKKKESGNTKHKAANSELNTEGLPPNAVDEEGNILVTDYDILCGRGGLTNHHKGNKRFRDIVALHRPDYVRAPKIQKPSVARVIVRAIRNGDPPGRFLRKDERSGKWIDIGDKKAAEKTSQALREKSNEERDKVRDTSNLGVLLPHASTYLAAATANAMGNILSGASALATTEAVAAAAAAATVNEAGNDAEMNLGDQKEKTKIQVSELDTEEHPAGDDERNKGDLSQNSEAKEDALAENAAEMTATQTCDV